MKQKKTQLKCSHHNDNVGLFRRPKWNHNELPLWSTDKLQHEAFFFCFRFFFSPIISNSHCVFIDVL